MLVYHRIMGLYTFSNLAKVPGVVQGIADRSFGSVAFEFGEEAALIQREKIRHELGLSLIVSAKQTHSDHIAVFHENDILPKTEIPDTDAFISNKKNVGFMIKTADCQPILMAGENRAGQPVVAAVHSGWKGSLKNIAGKTVRQMKTDFGALPHSITVGVGPSLGPCCAEFSNPDKELTAEALRYRIDESNRFDFWAMTHDQLTNEGVKAEAIEFSKICTVCSKDRWFSYRGDNPDVGRFGSVIGLV